MSPDGDNQNGVNQDAMAPAPGAPVGREPNAYLPIVLALTRDLMISVS